MKKLSILLITLTSSLALGHVSPAHADEYSASEEDGRRGLLLGFGVQGGHMRVECDGDDCGTFNESIGVDVHMAYMLSHKLALSVDGWMMVHRGETLGVDYTIAHTIVTIGPQFWLVPRLWVRGGLGWAWARTSYDAGPLEGQIDSENVLGVQASVGLELLQSQHFALDVQLRGGTGFYDGADVINAGVGVGFTWF